MNDKGRNVMDKVDKFFTGGVVFICCLFMLFGLSIADVIPKGWLDQIFGIGIAIAAFFGAIWGVREFTKGTQNE
jgi:hypothetical protein